MVPRLVWKMDFGFWRHESGVQVSLSELANDLWEDRGQAGKGAAGDGEEKGGRKEGAGVAEPQRHLQRQCHRCVCLAGLEAQQLSTSPESLRTLKRVLTGLLCRPCAWHVEEGSTG